MDSKLEKILETLHLSEEEAISALKQLQKPARKVNYHSHDSGGQHVRIGVVSDTHIGSKFFREDLFMESVATFKREGVERIYHPGDVIEGMSNRDGHIYELDVIGVTNQIKRAIMLLAQYHAPIYFLEGNHECLSMNTEVLTKRGWLTQPQLKKDDMIWSIELTSGIGRWDKIEAIIVKEKSDDGLMIDIDKKPISLSCTTKHRVLHRSHHINFGKWKYKEAKSFKEGARIIFLTSSYSPNPEYPIDENIIKFVAWILTDGHITNDKYRYFRIYQSKPHSMIEGVLNSLNLSYTVRIRQRNVPQGIKKALPQREYRISAKERWLHQFISTKKNIPSWVYSLSDRQFEIFLKEVIKGAGTQYVNAGVKRDCYILYGTRNFLSEMQALCHMHGFRATLTESTRGDYRLNIVKKTTAAINHEIRMRKSDEPVWCLQVPLTNFLIRRDGKCHFTGNSWAIRKANQGVEIGEQLEEKLKGKGTFLGHTEANIQIAKGVTMRITHEGAASYALSYSGQKRINAVDGGTKPDLWFNGHIHKMLFMQYRNIHYFEAASLQSQTPFMRMKGTPSVLGYWVIDIHSKKKGGLESLGVRFFPGY